MRRYFMTFAWAAVALILVARQSEAKVLTGPRNWEPGVIVVVPAPGLTIPGPGNHLRPSPVRHESSLVIEINRVVMNERLLLRKIMGGMYQGRVIGSVEVIARPHLSARHNDLSLFINGYMEDRLNDLRQSNVLWVRGYKALGREISTLQLEVLGSVFVDAVVIHFAD